MNDILDLEDRLRELAAAVPSPEVPVEDDLARGRRRLGVQRLLTTGGAVAAVAVIALAIGIGQSVTDKSSGSGPAGPAATQGTPLKPKVKVLPQTGGELLQVYRDVLVVHLDPSGEHLQVKPDNLQSGGGLGTKLGWRIPGEEGLGMVEIFVGDGWGGFVGGLCGDDGQQCVTKDVDGIHATVSESDGVTSVLVKRDDGSNVLLTVNPLFGNNSLVPVSAMDISVDDMIRAAGDPRLVEATPEQIRNAGTSMGFPDYDDLGALEEGQSEAPVPSR